MQLCGTLLFVLKMDCFCFKYPEEQRTETKTLQIASMSHACETSSRRRPFKIVYDSQICLQRILKGRRRDEALPGCLEPTAVDVPIAIITYYKPQTASIMPSVVR